MGITLFLNKCFRMIIPNYGMEEVLLRRYIPVLQKTEKFRQDADEPLEQEDLRLLIREVLNEIDSSRRPTEETNNEKYSFKNCLH